jgi:hypothetical protein
MPELVGIVAVLSVFGFPVMALFLRHRHLERMHQLETQENAGRLAGLEAARADLENRVRTLETIATSGDGDLEERLKRIGQQLEGSPERPLLRSGQR